MSMHFDMSSKCVMSVHEHFFYDGPNLMHFITKILNWVIIQNELQQTSQRYVLLSTTLKIEYLLILNYYKNELATK